MRHHDMRKLWQNFSFQMGPFENYSWWLTFSSVTSQIETRIKVKIRKKNLKHLHLRQSIQEYFIQNLRPLITHTVRRQKRKRMDAVPMETHLHTTQSTAGQTAMWGGEKGQWRLIIEKWKGTWEQWEQIKAKHHTDIYEKKMWQNKLHLHLPLNASVQLGQHELVLALRVCWYDIKHSKRCKTNYHILSKFPFILFSKLLSWVMVAS